MSPPIHWADSNLDGVMTRRSITIAEAADYLQISDRPVRRLVADGELTGYRTGRSRRVIRVNLNEIDHLLMRPLNEPRRARRVLRARAVDRER